MKKFLVGSLSVLTAVGMGLTFTACSSNSDDSSSQSAMIAVTSSTGSTSESEELGWITINGHTVYKNSDGTYAKGGFKQIEGETYYFDSKGYLLTGWIQVQNKWYYMDEKGRMQTDWTQVDGKWYYLGTQGQMQTGWHFLLGKWYYMDESSGVMQTGWVQVNGSWYYMNESGVMQTGWIQIGDDWYYTNESGVMLTGWQEINGQRYFFEDNGLYNQAASEYTLVEASEIQSYFEDVSITTDNWSNYFTFQEEDGTGDDGSYVRNEVLRLNSNYLKTGYNGQTLQFAEPSDDFSMQIYYSLHTTTDYVSYSTGQVANAGVSVSDDDGYADVSNIGDTAFRTYSTAAADAAGYYQYTSTVNDIGVTTSTGTLRVCNIPDDKWNTDESTGERFIAVRVSDTRIVKFYETGTTSVEDNGTVVDNQYSSEYDSPFGWDLSYLN